ncbi:MAG: 4-hydroxy-tetrahydrodipicolinate reductase [bacterium]|nr:4-hydroxy-tetrahydrodipicolinate reductase [bacterium]
MVKITISGGRGQMGIAVFEAARSFKDIKVIHILESANHPDVGKVFDGIKVTSSINDCLITSDCIVEFSTPQATLMHIEFASKLPKPFVIGTTGFSDDEIKKIKEYSKIAPVLMSSNFSFGIAVMLKVVEDLAKLLYDYEIEVFEIHHNKKRDAPSGTALMIIEKILKARGLTKDKISKGVRKQDEVGIHSLRGGSVVGEHSVIFFSQGERLEVRHIAESRHTFARGALLGATWIVKKKSGFYNLDEFTSEISR